MAVEDDYLKLVKAHKHIKAAGEKRQNSGS